ncbi:MAG TPA: hypothetical protein GX714_07505 [Chloroflexi bacterium]|jgi:uncharacterized protein YdhG (YjbR/CyaY superfamily)|nr:hypothetical protein [Chloroflexota bacterium]
MIAEKMDVTSVEAYIAGFPEEIQAILQRVRATIKEAAPDAQEAIKYGLPTMVLHGNLVHFGAFRDHIGFYPTPSGIEAFRDELRPYRLRKGTVQFPLDEPIPYDLIRRITRYRVQENLEKARRK